MGTPSEVIAGRALENLGFKNVKFVDKGYDFVASLNENPCAIEVKEMSSSKQIKELLKAKSEGKSVFLLGIYDDSYCLFQLRRGIPRPRKASKPKRSFSIIATRRYVAKNDQTLRLYHILFGSETK